MDRYFRKLYRQMAKKYHTTPQEFRQQLVDYIDEIHNSPAADDEGWAMRAVLFPGGQKPTPEEFISRFVTVFNHREDFRKNMRLDENGSFEPNGNFAP